MARESKPQSGSSTSEDIEMLCPKGPFPTYGWAYSRGVSFADIGLYGLLGSFGTYNAETHSYQGCNPSRAQLARIGGCSVETISRSLERLLSAGLIERHERYAEDGGRLPNEYTVRCGTLHASHVSSSCKA
jgi:hypothetical protein